MSRRPSRAVEMAAELTRRNRLAEERAKRAATDPRRVLAATLRNRLSDPQVWRTRDGRAIRVDAMEDSHLLNTIAYLSRRASRYIAENELSASVDEVLMRSFPQYPNMLAEAVRRGLMDIVPGRPRVGKKKPAKRAPAKVPASAYARFAGLIFDEGV